MKILLLGDASNYNATLAPALVALGHEVTVASNGGAWMDSQRHVDISRSPSRLGGARLYRRLLSEGALGRGYDAVFLCDTSFVELRPHRQLEVFKHLRRHNGRVFLTALGTNALYVENLTGSNPALPFSEWQSPWGQANKHQWLTRELLDYSRYVYEHVDGIATALYEYDAVARAIVPGQKIVYAGIPVAEVPAVERPAGGPLTILAAFHPGREAEKGIDVLMPLIYRLMREYGKPVRLESASGIPFGEFQRRLAGADIVVDQLYALSPATTALMAMRAGAVPVTGGHADWLRFVGAESAPLIATDPRDLNATYEAILSGADRLPGLRAAAPSFTAANSPAAVASRLSALLNT